MANLKSMSKALGEVRDLIAELEHIEELMVDCGIVDTDAMESIREELVCQSGTIGTILELWK